MKKLFTTAGIASMAFLLSACFVIQGFTITDYTVAPGQTTKARLTLRPNSTTEDSQIHFILIGVNNTDMAINKATWGTNGKFGGPLAMVNTPGFSTVLAGESCSANGLDFATVTGVTWKSFLTPKKIRDRGLVEQSAVTEIGLKAKATATPDQSVTVFAVLGIYEDDGDTVVDADDAFLCTGISTATAYIT